MIKLRNLAALALTLALASCAAPPRIVPAAPAPAPRDYGFRRSVDALTYTDVAYHEWETPENLTPAPARERTLLIYMNGSDLESDTAAGTRDLKELARSGVDTERVNVVVFTGGADRWHSKNIPSGECMISALDGGKIKNVAAVGLRDMGDAGTLAAFLKFGLEYYPAEKTSLVLWDHGGGSIAGYGADEKFNMSTLTLLELEYALARAGLAEQKLELLGFDACLMASVEMAVVASRYADLLVASESLEPGDGWDYTAIRAWSDAENSAAQLGKAVADAFIASAGPAPEEELSLSVVKTAEAENVMGALGLLAEKCAVGLQNGDFPRLIALRRDTKTFGDGAPPDTDCDMVDLADLARAFGALYPEEAALLTGALARAVLYNRYDSDRALGGLSAYHTYGGGDDAPRSLEVYAKLQMSEKYTRYLVAFASHLPRGSKTTKAPRVSEILGERVRLYEISRPSGGALYAAPCRVNGARADALVFFENGAASGRLLGYRKRDGYLLQKGYDPLTPSDALTLKNS
ncbi:MAG: hypothetical protein LBN99_06670 [Oscillospiraceae bacterium]|jgi:hypothetical protein|nr:hypothetical protein [Oscillospiraceae bacterium]